MYKHKKPTRPSKPKTPKVLYALLAVVLLMSVGFIANYVYNEYMSWHGGSHSQYDIPHYVPYIPTHTPPPVPAPTLVIQDEATEPDPTPEPEPEPTPDPGPTPPPRIMRQEFLDYREYFGNDGIVGHIYVPGTTIDYIVPQTTDNSFYLYHDIRKRRAAAGWVWLCYRADVYRQDQNMVIFGHNMARNHMLHGVRNFFNEDFFFNNRYIYFRTIYADYVFEVFSVYITHISFPYIYENYHHRYGGWERYINMFVERSHFDAGISVSADDRIITLSTCHRDLRMRDYRYVVHGRLVSETFPHIEGLGDLESDIITIEQSVTRYN
ncbi:MAG: class B sortase [Defluviitaleaceae bacterium]|nr:class B sortase [Defluviitaleaceae bacterium]